MRRILLVFIISLVFLGTGGQVVVAQDYPTPLGFVNDFAGVLSDETYFDLEDRLTRLEEETSAEVTVVTIASLDGNSMEEYAAGLFQAWGIGKKNEDNGVLFIVAIEERDVRIEVGYGLEPVITDGRAGRILDDKVVPYLKDNNYDQGIKEGVLAIESYIRDGSPPSAVEENPVHSVFSNVLSSFRIPLPVIIVLGFVTVYLLGFMARTKSIWLGGIWGIILGVVLGFGFGMTLLMIVLPIGLGLSGLFLDWILSSNYRGRSSRGMSTGWFSSGGGFRGSGGGSGGFGGFGGGHSGGGGAGRGF